MRVFSFLLIRGLKRNNPYLSFVLYRISAFVGVYYLAFGCLYCLWYYRALYRLIFSLLALFCVAVFSVYRYWLCLCFPLVCFVFLLCYILDLWFLYSVSKSVYSAVFLFRIVLNFIFFLCFQ